MVSKTIMNNVVYRFDNPLEEETDLSGGGQQTPEQIEAARVAAETKISADAEAARVAADAAAANQVQKVTLDNVEYKLDDKGNALKEDGTVFKTKEEIENAPNVPDSIVGRIILNTGITPLDEQGVPIVFDDSEEGIALYVQKSLETQRAEYATEIENAFKESLDSNFKRYYNAISSGISEEDYFKEFVLPASQDFKVTAKSTDEDFVRIIAKSYELQGVKPDKALEFAQFSAKQGTAKADATKAEKEIADVQTQKEIEVERNRIEQEKQAIKETNDYWDSIRTTIKSGKLREIVIPVVEQDKFFEYQAVPVDKQGNSQFALDMQKAGIEGEQLMKYMFFKGFNTNNILRDAMNKSRVETLTEKLAAQKKAAALGGHNPSGNLKELNNDF